MSKQNIGPRLEPGTKDFYEAHFRTVNAGAEYVLEMFPNLYRRTLATLWVDSGITFSAQELYLIIDVCNSPSYISTHRPGFAGQHLITEVSNAIFLDHAAEKWNCEAGLEDKLVCLTIWELAVLEIWARAFWDGKTEDKLEDYVKILAEG
jgi:hypothetical protein